MRLDDASAAALEIVRATEMSDSEAVRTALQEAAARQSVRSTIAREVAELAGLTWSVTARSRELTSSSCSRA